MHCAGKDCRDREGEIPDVSKMEVDEAEMWVLPKLASVTRAVSYERQADGHRERSRSQFLLGVFSQLTGTPRLY